MRRVTATLAAAALLFGAGPTLAQNHGGEIKEPPKEPGAVTAVPCPPEGSVAQAPGHAAGAETAVKGEVKIVPCPQEQTAETAKETSRSGAQPEKK